MSWPSVATVANRYGILHCARAQSLSTIYPATTLIAHSTSSLANDRACASSFASSSSSFAFVGVGVAAYIARSPARTNQSSQRGEIRRRSALLRSHGPLLLSQRGSSCPLRFCFLRILFSILRRLQLRNYRTFNLAWFQDGFKEESIRDANNAFLTAFAFSSSS